MSAPSGLYVHIPFCIRRCAYCAFASGLYDPVRADRYLTALTSEFSSRLPGFAPETVYIGGGTPTSLSPGQLTRLLDLVRQLDLSRLREFTIEANPGTLNMEKAILLKEAGVNRVSLGVQTFRAEGLQTLSRPHHAKQARLAVSLCHEAGLNEISLDFIYAWPGQKLAWWREDLEKALRLNIEHLSCYCLTNEPGTPLSRLIETGRLTTLAETEERALFDLTGEFLPARGMRRYEIGNFCLPGHECRHNLNYWTGGDYHGLGCGAHSHVDGMRFANSDDTETYIRKLRQSGSARVFCETLPPERAARECAVIWLRMSEGIDGAAFHARTGFELQELFSAELPPLMEQGWLEWSPNRCLRLSDQALPVADSVLSELV